MANIKFLFFKLLCLIGRNCQDLIMPNKTHKNYDYLYVIPQIYCKFSENNIIIYILLTLYLVTARDKLFRKTTTTNNLYNL